MDKREKAIKGLEVCEWEYEDYAGYFPEDEIIGKNERGHNIYQSVCEKCPYNAPGKMSSDCLEELHRDALELLKEIKPYGGFIEFPDVVGNLIGYTTIVEHMLKAGILKVEKQEAPMFTRYNWAIKAVKWDD